MEQQSIQSIKENLWWVIPSKLAGVLDILPALKDEDSIESPLRFTVDSECAYYQMSQSLRNT